MFFCGFSLVVFVLLFFVAVLVFLVEVVRLLLLLVAVFLLADFLAFARTDFVAARLVDDRFAVERVLFGEVVLRSVFDMKEHY